MDAGEARRVGLLPPSLSSTPSLPFSLHTIFLLLSPLDPLPPSRSLLLPIPTVCDPAHQARPCRDPARLDKVKFDQFDPVENGAQRAPCAHAVPAAPSSARVFPALRASSMPPLERPLKVVDYPNKSAVLGT